MCCDAPSAPQVDPRQGEALNKQADTANRIVEHTIESDRLSRERLERLDEQQKPLIDQYYQNQMKQEARADIAYQRYEEFGIPAINRMINDANTFDSAANLADIRGRAASDVEQAFAARRGDTMRTMQRMGIDPLDGRSMAAMGDMDAKAGLAKVTAMNTAADGRTVQGMQLRQQVGNLVNGMSAQSLNLSQASKQACMLVVLLHRQAMLALAMLWGYRMHSTVACKALAVSMVLWLMALAISTISN